MTQWHLARRLAKERLEENTIDDTELIEAIERARLAGRRLDSAILAAPQEAQELPQRSLTSSPQYNFTAAIHNFDFENAVVMQVPLIRLECGMLNVFGCEVPGF